MYYYSGMQNFDQSAVQPTSPSTPQPTSPTSFSSTVPLHSFNQQPVNEVQGTKGNMSSSNNKLFLFLAVVVIVAGVATGAGISKLKKPMGDEEEAVGGQTIQQVAGNEVKNGQVFGSTKQDFKDNTEGYLEVGGIEGEGTHKLLRDGGPTQTVALTSSVTDLSKFEHMKVKIWGETNKGQKAPWFMDVGKVEVIDTKAQPPATE
jgi:hypothetical protein